MASTVNVNIKATNKASAPIRRASRDVKKLGEDASNAAKKANKDWGGVGDLFSGLLPRGLQSSIRGFKSAQRQIGRLSKGFKVLKGAIASTGLGLLVVALGEIVANWDSISESITAASDETQKQVDLAKEQVQLSQDNLDAISQQENILKLQGKTEEDLLAMRMAATDEAIAAQEIMVQSLIDQTNEQVKFEEQAKNASMAILALISAPLTVLLTAVDALTYGLAQIGVMEEATTLVTDYLEGGASLLGFDPDKAREDGNKLIDEAEDQLLKLENQRAGYQLRRNKMDDDAKEEQNRKDEQDAAKRLADEQYVADQIVKIQRDMTLQMLEDDEQRALKKREFEYKDAKAQLEARGATDEQLLILEQQYDADRLAIQKQFQDQRDAQDQDELKARQELATELEELQMSEYDLEERRLMQLYDQRVAIAGDDEGLIRAATEQLNADLEKLREDADAKERDDAEQQQERLASLRENAAMDLIGIFRAFNDKERAQQDEQSRKNFEASKRIQLAETIMSTYAAAQKAYQSQMTVPSPDAPIRAAISAGSAIAAGLAKVAKIKAMKYESPDDGGGDTATGGGAVRRMGNAGLQGWRQGMVPNVQFTGGQIEPLHAYVVQSDLQGSALEQERLDYQTVL